MLVIMYMCGGGMVSVDEINYNTRTSKFETKRRRQVSLSVCLSVFLALSPSPCYETHHTDYKIWKISKYEENSFSWNLTVTDNHS